MPMPTWSDVFAAGADLVLPVVCGGCGRPGESWCARCTRHLSDVPVELHPRVTPAASCWALSRYRGTARHAVIAHKEHGRRDLAAPLGAALARGLVTLARWGEIPDTDRLHLIPAPTRATSARRRGGDTVTAIAAAAARTLGPGVDVRPMLATSMFARDSAGLSARERTDNLRGTVRLRRAARRCDCRRCTYVLVDDVMTTGSTATESVRVLGLAGIPTACVVVIAMA